MSLNSKTKWMNCPRNIRSFPFYSTHSPSITTLPTTFRHSLSPIPISNSPSFFHVSLLSSVNHQRYQHITVLINPHFFMWILTRNPTLLLKAVTITKTQLNMMLWNYGFDIFCVQYIGIGTLNSTDVVIHLVNRSVAYPACFIEDVLVRVGELIFPLIFIF